jgi:argininosuccinate lyase
MVLYAVERELELHELPLDQMKRFSEAIDSDIYEALSLEKTLESKSQAGGTSRSQVAKALAEARKSLLS